MAKAQSIPRRELDESTALRMILEGTATETGSRFFKALVKNLALALDTYGAWVTEYFPEKRTLRAHAFWLAGDWIPHWEMQIDGSPCERVIETAQLVHFPDNILAIYPNDSDLTSVGAVSYMGVPLKDSNGAILGHLAVLDRKPLPQEPRLITVFQIFAARAAAELQRINAEKAVREREEQLGRVVSSAMDAIIEIDARYIITLVNPAAEKTFACSSSQMMGRPLSDFVADEDWGRIESVLRQLNELPEGQQRAWLPGNLTAKRTNGRTFSAEATISRFDTGHASHHTIILRDVNDRLEAEHRIHSLTVETEYLRQKLRKMGYSEELLGQSEAMRRMMEDLAQVAQTDTTVLITGETGTGKELVARAIHKASRRREGPLIRVNCAAVPAALMESEFFGHEKGAFTGATCKREGRFALADGGTIFLDEVGELPIDLQAKLLRVLQEGEFEPVGSSKTQHVDVRVLAATNRDLEKAIERGAFREDLYYRLDVFPVRVPPLRERGDDVVLLATEFANEFARQMGKSIAPLTSDCAERLKAYTWPGNVRELQNVIERAVITARDGRLNLERALPEVAPATRHASDPADTDCGRVLTVDELRELERGNIVRALEIAGWKVAGETGAARKLGVSASTLSSRMKALGIERLR